jgi:hypothetical protein
MNNYTIRLLVCPVKWLMDATIFSLGRTRCMLTDATYGHGFAAPWELSF